MTRNDRELLSGSRLLGFRHKRVPGVLARASLASLCDVDGVGKKPARGLGGRNTARRALAGHGRLGSRRSGERAPGSVRGVALANWHKQTRIELCWVDVNQPFHRGFFPAKVLEDAGGGKLVVRLLGSSRTQTVRPGEVLDFTTGFKKYAVLHGRSKFVKALGLGVQLVGGRPDDNTFAENTPMFTAFRLLLAMGVQQAKATPHTLVKDVERHVRKLKGCLVQSVGVGTLSRALAKEKKASPSAILVQLLLMLFRGECESSSVVPVFDMAFADHNQLRFQLCPVDDESKGGSTDKSEGSVGQEDRRTPRSAGRRGAQPQKKRARSTTVSEESEQESGSVAAEDSGVASGHLSDSSGRPSEADLGVEVAKVLGIREASGGGKEVLVKFRDRSYLHVEWVAYDALVNTKFGKTKLRRFEQQEEGEEEGAEEDAHEQSSVEQDDEDEDEFFDSMFTRVDRIVSVRGSGDKKEAFVKWCHLQYSESTWEHVSDLHDPGLVSEYEARIGRLGRLPATRRMPKSADYQVNTPTSPPKFKDNLKLMNHQLAGLRWLVRCWYDGKGSLLADEMGLGKTVQIVAFFDHLRKEQATLPFLVVAPLSTLTHWRREIESWTSLSALKYAGDHQSRSVIRQFDWVLHKGKQPKYKWDVLVTSYDTLRVDYQHLQRIHWECIVVDEAQAIKNHESRVHECVRTLRKRHTVLLTGTPLQNNTRELWSLLSLLERNGRLVGDLASFEAAFGEIKTPKQAMKLRKLLSGVMLRREKKDVLKEIPPKEETVVEVELTRVQKQYYRAIFERNRAFLTTSKNRGCVQLTSVVMQLRKCCNHPYLLDGVREELEARGAKEKQVSEAKEGARPAQDAKVASTGGEGAVVTKQHRAMEPGSPTHTLVHASGKMLVLHKLLAKLRADGHKVLVFSGFKIVLNIIEEYLGAMGFQYERVDGDVTGIERQKAIDRFMAKESDRFVFLLTTRAGGVGINLTAADTVVIFDSDWNPQSDVQAQSRCHRIGQTNPVKVFRLLTRNTYEQTMFDKASQKLGLSRALLHGASKKGAKAKADSLERLLRLGAYQVLHKDKKGKSAQGEGDKDEDEDEEARKFSEKDIEQILSQDSRVVRFSDEFDSSSAGSTVGKALFALGEAGGGVALDDPDFWQKMMPRVSPVEDLRRLLTASGDDNAAVKPEQVMDAATVQVRAYVENLLTGHAALQEQGPLLDFLEELQVHQRFAAHRGEVEKLINEVHRPTRKRRVKMASLGTDVDAKAPPPKKRKQAKKDDGDAEYKPPESDSELEVLEDLWSDGSAPAPTPTPAPPTPNAPSPLAGAVTRRELGFNANAQLAGPHAHHPSVPVVVVHEMRTGGLRVQLSSLRAGALRQEQHQQQYHALKSAQVGHSAQARPPSSMPASSTGQTAKPPASLATQPPQRPQQQPQQPSSSPFGPAQKWTLPHQRTAAQLPQRAQDFPAAVAQMLHKQIDARVDDSSSAEVDTPSRGRGNTPTLPDDPRAQPPQPMRQPQAQQQPQSRPQQQPQPQLQSQQSQPQVQHLQPQHSRAQVQPPPQQQPQSQQLQVRQQQPQPQQLLPQQPQAQSQQSQSPLPQQQAMHNPQSRVPRAVALCVLCGTRMPCASGSNLNALVSEHVMQKWRDRDPMHQSPELISAYIFQLNVPWFVKLLALPKDSE